jgi:hypothetical protein
MFMDFLRRSGRFSPVAVVLLLLISYGTIAYGLLISNGMYHPPALLWVGGGWVALCLAAVLFRHASGHTSVSTLFFRIACAVAVMMFLFMGQSAVPGIYIRQPDFIVRFKSLSLLMVLLVLIILLISSVRSLRWMHRGLFVACLLFFASLYFGMLRASPAPVIDVFSMLRDSSASLLQGLNPYTTPFVDPYGGAPGLPWNKAEVLVYPPVTLLPAVAGAVLAGDVRFFSVVSVLFVGLMLWWVVRRKDEVAGELLCLLWLAHPRGLFVIEQSWVDPAALAVLGMAILLLRSKFIAYATALFGLFVSFKQYLIFALVPAMRITRSPRSLAWLLLPPLIVALPFFIWDPAAFINNAILFQLKTAFRSDSLTLAAYLSNVYGIGLGKWWTLLVGVTASGMTFLLPSTSPRTTLLFSMSLIFLSFFFLGVQGFCNYYYFACGLILMTLALMIGEERQDELIETSEMN